MPAKGHLVWRDLLNIDLEELSLPWQPFHPGVDILPLNGTPSGCFCALLRYAPGAAVPMHQHIGHEHIFILRGAQSDERGRYERGTFLINLPDSSHRVVSEEGCIVLAIWESPVRFL